MGQPLFLHSVMQEKIWGGTRLKEEFGYEIPSDHVGEFGRFQPIHMEFLK